MEWITEIISSCLISILGVIITSLAAYLGRLAGKIWRDKAQSEAVQNLAKTTVHAVEQMYGDFGGEAKLERALYYLENLLKKKGIVLPAEEMRILLEAALCEWKGGFEQE